MVVPPVDPASMRPSIANIMRRFDRIVNDESDHSNPVADGDNVAGEGLEQ